MQAIKDKIEIYPPYPEASTNSPYPSPRVIFRPRPIADEIDQLKARVIHAESKLQEHIKASMEAAKKREAKTKLPTYKGLSS